MRRSQARDARATRRAGSRGAPNVRAHDRIPFRAHCNRRDAAEGGRVALAMHVPLARAGAAARRLPAVQDQTAQLVLRKRRDAARAGGSPARCGAVNSERSRDVGRRRDGNCTSMRPRAGCLPSSME